MYNTGDSLTSVLFCADIRIRAWSQVYAAHLTCPCLFQADFLRIELVLKMNAVEHSVCEILSGTLGEHRLIRFLAL